MDKNKLSNIIEKIFLAEKTGRIIYSNEFYTPDLCKDISHLCKERNCNFYSYGVFKEAQRNMVAFSVQEEIDLDYPLQLLEVKVNSKFTKLQHKDFLGSIMALGIKREKIGDLILQNNSCYLPVSNDIADFIKYNLEYINKSPCKIQVLDISSDTVPQYIFEERIINIASNRLDSFVSGICNISRNKSIELINRGSVLVDYSIMNKKDYKPKDGTILTIRGYGKYKIGDILGYTQKDRMKILIKKFI